MDECLMARADYRDHARHKKPPHRTRRLAEKVVRAAEEAEELTEALLDYEEPIAAANMEMAIIAVREAALALSVVVGSLPSSRDRWEAAAEVTR